MAAARFAVHLLCFVASSAGITLQVVVHYPDQHSPVDLCGFKLKVATSADLDPEKPTDAEHSAPDTWIANIVLSDDLVFTELHVGAMAEVDPILLASDACQQVCPRMGPQGLPVQTGPYGRITSLQIENKLEMWPAFCRLEWGTREAHFYSSAIGRHVMFKMRMPAALLENPLPRPTAVLPPILFRFNAEWYWPRPEADFNTWHDLMSNGDMEPWIAAELYTEGNEWNSWGSQPIYTTEDLRPTCGTCVPELEFICQDWEAHGSIGYAGGNHSFGTAAAFFQQLYYLGLPVLLKELPSRTDETTLRVGVWGYCIGGLAAWNAIATSGGLFNIAYLGSPAMDYDCGDPFLGLDNLTFGPIRPKIYIDAGAAEGVLMTRQTLMLFRKLQEKGLVEGKELFYYRQEFGTHQGRGLLRRTLRGLQALFGAGQPLRAAFQAAGAVPPLSNVPAVSTVVVTAAEPSAPTTAWLPILFAMGVVTASFFLGRWTAAARRLPSLEPLLVA